MKKTIITLSKTRNFTPHCLFLQSSSKSFQELDPISYISVSGSVRVHFNLVDLQVFGALCHIVLLPLLLKEKI